MIVLLQQNRQLPVSDRPVCFLPVSFICTKRRAAGPVFPRQDQYAFSPFFAAQLIYTENMPQNYMNPQNLADKKKDLAGLQ